MTLSHDEDRHVSEETGPKVGDDNDDDFRFGLGWFDGREGCFRCDRYLYDHSWSTRHMGVLVDTRTE